MSDKTTILVADDEPNIRRVLEAMLTRNGYTVLTAENGKRAVAIATEQPIDVLITDLIMPDMTGVEVVRNIKELRPDCAAILVTAYATIKTAVEAMRLGAYDYVTKPFDLDQILKLVRRSLEDRDTQPAYSTKPVAAKAAKGKPGSATGIMVGSSPQMEDLQRTIDRVADSRATVLVRGESGTGKELVAKALHMRSIRSNKPFIAVSCAALPETLLESELFGHEKNAFTGAAAQKLGRFEMAHEGTLFLDEVAEIPPPIQVKLLRALQEREFERIGGTKTIKIDVRLVTATNKDLEKAVAEGEFREDLYYRLQVIQVDLPPLRERVDDIELLANHFIQKYNEENGRHIERIGEDALNVLKAYRWPGNVRELENTMERAVVMADPDASVITVAELPMNIVTSVEKGAAK
jgi:DNA-binding NtrC family response regulator